MWIKRHPEAVNLVLSFAGATCASLWAGHLISTDSNNGRANIVFVAALIILGVQWWYNAKVVGVRKRLVNALLDLGVRFVRSHAQRTVSGEDIRIIVHLCERTSPARGVPKQDCLVPHYWKASIRPRDGGAIPLEADDYKKFYFNVQAYHTQRVCGGEPRPEDRPDSSRAHVRTTELFDGKSVISAPIWSRISLPHKVIGTITIDAKHSIEDLRWCSEGKLNAAVGEMLEALADLIGQVLTNDPNKD